jgi:GT2 family glycosyltransferase
MRDDELEQEQHDEGRNDSRPGEHGATVYRPAPVDLTVIVPVWNDARSLDRCLRALIADRGPGVELMVVDDASTDDSAAVAGRFPVELVRLRDNVGPAAARNRGAARARGDLLFFVDSDVAVAPGALARVRTLFEARPDVAAAFGSYDASPAAPGVVSRYKNLLHHFVHQHGAERASTFWAGCGAIRRRVFEALGGFDERRFRRPSIEDIELGYRLRRAGHRIVLDKGLLGTHLKRWTVGSLLRTDIRARAIPWAELLLTTREPIDDLNLRRDQRWSAALTALAAAALVLTPLWIGLAPIAAGLLLGVVVLNRELYGFFARQGGLAFAAACVLLHWLYYLYSGAAYLAVWARLRLGWSPALPADSGPR